MKNDNIFNLNEQETARIIRNSAMRRELANKSFRHFIAIYFFRYLSYPIAPFHEDFFTIAEDEKIMLAIILAFRGSAKSTIFSSFYPIWAVTGHQKKKFVLIITQTQQQARKIMNNIKSQFEDNDLLKADSGPFEESEEWSSTSIVLKDYGARIMVASAEQSVRGLLNKQHRPDVIILDDVEDLASVKKQEGRDKLFDWYTGDIVALGDRNTKYLFLGTRLHNDDLPSRLISEIKENQRDGVYMEIPIVQDGKITWIGKYPDMDAVESEKRKVGNRIAWEREFMLNLISPEEQLIKPEWITYYDKLPSFANLSYVIVGVDLAIKQTESSDFTSMISIYVYGEGREAQFYVATPIINRRLTLHATSTTALQLYMSLPKGYPVTFVVEDVGYQLAAIEEMKSDGIPVEGTKVHGQDKYTRASIVSPLFEQKRVHFPPSGAEECVKQIVGFPNETHDDMVDALVYALLKIQEEEFTSEPQLIIAETYPNGNYRFSN